MKRRIVVALVFVLAVGLCAGLIWFNFFRDKMITEFFANMQPPPQTVSAAKVEAKTWTPGIGAIGTARAANGVELAFEIAGIVKRDQVQGEPEAFAKGEVLVQLDDTVERADLQDVQAAVKTAESSFERAQTLSTRGYGTEANLDQASALLAAARSRLARIQATIEQKALKAPFSGVIGIPRIDVGQYLQPGTVIASFQDLSSMKVDFTVPEQARERDQARPGSPRRRRPRAISPSRATSPARIRASIRRHGSSRFRPSSKTTRTGRSFRASSSMWRRSCRRSRTS